MADNIITKIINPSPRGRIWRAFLLIIFLVAAAGMVDAGSYYNRGADWIADKSGNSINLPRTKDIPFRLGLDLLGGAHLVYRANVSEIPAGDQSSALEGVRDVIERRVNVFGVSEPLVQTNISGGDYRVIVELAGIKDINEAIKMIGETPLLEFKEQQNQLRELTGEEKDQMDAFNKESEQKAEEVLGKLISGGDFTALAKEYNQDEATRNNGGDLGWITASQRSDIVNIVKDYGIGDTSRELINTGAGFEIFKLEDKRKKTNPFNENEAEIEVRAAHILVCFEGKEGCDSGLGREEARNKIDELKSRATVDNFADLARENSTGPSGLAGGDLGWFERTAMVKLFPDTIFSQTAGSISDVVETDFGFHLIYKQEERVVEEYKVRRLLLRTIAAADIIGEQKDWKNTELTGKHLERARVQFNPNDNRPEVGLEFDGEGSDLFAEITERNIDKQVAIFLDGYAISVPTVNEKIMGGRAVISGSFNIKEAKLLAQRLNAGALPVPIELINQQTVGASLGRISLESSLRAGIIGLILVALFMILFYRLPGLLAVVSLSFYGILVLAIFKIWPVTLTLSGMAGFILSVGMAVDANVLIFERFKEELRSRKPLDLAIGDSFDRAWPSIRDGNVSTIITCVILIWFSTGIVKGFAVTLLVGVLVSMFSAIIITKILLQLIAGSWLEKNRWLVGVKKITDSQI